MVVANSQLNLQKRVRLRAQFWEQLGAQFLGQGKTGGDRDVLPQLWAQKCGDGEALRSVWEIVADPVLS